MDWLYKIAFSDDEFCDDYKLSSEPIVPKIKAPKSKEFHDWFSGSKGIDEQGLPRVFYHGSKKDFNQFEEGRAGRNSNVFGGWDVQRAGFFFTPDPRLAFEFAQQGEERMVGEHIKPVYLSIFDPIDLRNGFSDSQLNSLESLGLNPRYYYNVSPSNMWEIFDYENGGRELVAALKKMEYDGAIILEPNSTNYDIETWVAFDPTQIKSATGNTGSWNRDDPSIVAKTQNWLQKIAFHQIKLSQLNGEWFLDDSGYATFADGDIGDLNLQVPLPQGEGIAQSKEGEHKAS